MVESKTELTKQQEFTACQLGLQAVLDQSEEGLVWFTSSVAQLPLEWCPFLKVALLDGLWRRSEDPVEGVIIHAVLAAGSVGRRDLVSVFWQARRRRRPPRDLMDHGKRGGYVTGSGQVNSSENATEEAREQKLRRRGIHDGGAPLGTIKDLVKDEYLSDSGDVDWEKVGTRVGLDAEQIKLLVARASGTTTRCPDNQGSWKRLQRQYAVIFKEIYNEPRASELGVD